MSDKLPFFDRVAARYSRLLGTFFVKKCVICGEPLWDKDEICPECLRIWEAARLSRCTVCGKTARACACRPMLLTATERLGERFLSSLVFFGKPDSEDEKDLAVRSAVTALKKSSDRRCVKFASSQMAADLLRYFLAEGEKPSDWIICYPPRTRSRIRTYGFDHGRELAESISEYSGIPARSIFWRAGDELQKNLTLPERKRAAERSLKLKSADSVAGKKFIIVDDIITTGATVNAAATLLLEAGAAAVFPVSFARTRLKKRKVKRKKPQEHPWFLKV